LREEEKEKGKKKKRKKEKRNQKRVKTLRILSIKRLLTTHPSFNLVERNKITDKIKFPGIQTGIATNFFEMIFVVC
jgi:hypothetical protein